MTDSVIFTSNWNISIEQPGIGASNRSEPIRVAALAPGVGVDIEIGIEPVLGGTKVSAIPSISPGTGNETLGWCCFLKASDIVVIRVFNFGIQA